MSTKKSGQLGEETAAAHLDAKGYVILARNYRSRYGEIDIIAQQQGIVVFIEVKLRKNARFALAAEHVGPAKIQKLKNTALIWLSEKNNDSPCRFDVIEVYTSSGELRINHIESAF